MNTLSTRASARPVILAALLLVAMTTQLQAQVTEVLVLDFTGTSYVKRAGRRFSEGIRIGQHYAEGSQIMVEKASSATFLGNDGKLIKLGPDSNWTIGQPVQTQPLAVPAETFPLWEALVAKTRNARLGASQSTVVGAIRTSGDEQALKDQGTTAEIAMKRQLALTLVAGSPSLNARLQALFLESLGLAASAEEAYLSALRTAASRDEKNTALEAYLELLIAHQNVAKAEAIKKEYGD